jgi:hypothetical protein
MRRSIENLVNRRWPFIRALTYFRTDDSVYLASQLDFPGMAVTQQLRFLLQLLKGVVEPAATRQPPIVTPNG